VQHNGGRRGRDKAAAKAWRARRAWVDLGQGRAIWPRAYRGLSGLYPLARIAARHRRPGGRRPLPLDGTEQGRGREKESEGRERKSEGPGVRTRPMGLRTWPTSYKIRGGICPRSSLVVTTCSIVELLI
jgi:hypothetical protein